MRWVFSSIWLVYLIQPIYSLIHNHRDPLYVAGGVIVIALFCAIYVPIVGNGIRWPRLARYGLVAITLLAALACAVYGKDWIPLWIYVSAATGIVLAGAVSKHMAFLAIGAVGACYTFFGWLTHDNPSDYLVVLLPVLLVGIAMMGFRMQIELMRELGQARETVAKMAVSEERLRLARDMHDLTGQSLSMITLKSDLASKHLGRLPRSPETAAIHAELADIARVSRQTLHDIREAVSGYRRPTLAIELITARTALEAAGIHLDDDPELITRSGTFDDEAEAALAWCLREAVANVIRHSGARNCAIRLIERRDELSLEITDDGSGPNPASPKTGNGLRNMSERLSAVGGGLTLSPARPHGFHLTAAVSL
ncbi:MAG: sensor histidine kinase [Streptosporangiaceae bacterium]|nr:sensor histidine kinase [Streptosporangiaceae bacterium]